MCGRYSFAPKPKQLETELPGIQLPLQLEISYNIAPTHKAYVVHSQQPLQFQKMEWGLVPHWSADGKNQGKLINARAEGIEEKPSFRDPIQSRRCLVPADSFYEWRTEPGGKKAPYRIFLEGGGLIFMGGIWDEWRQGDTLKQTFSIITTGPNQEMSALHNRMPLILSDAAAREQWLFEKSLPNVLQMMKPLEDGQLRMYRVSEQLNKPGYDQEDLHKALPEPWLLF
jgi:putative SOS response-associated peptidase YedK